MCFKKSMRKWVSGMLVFLLGFTLLPWQALPLLATAAEIAQETMQESMVQTEPEAVYAVVYGKDTNTVKLEIEIDLINPPLNSLGQAARPADTFTLFTRDHVASTTKTNQWGVEVAVKNEEVIFVSESYSGDTEIPINGFVISVIDSSGTANRDLLRNNIAVGDRILLSGITIPQEEEVLDGVTDQDGDFIAVQVMDPSKVENENVIYSANYTYHSTQRMNATEFIIIDNVVTEVNTKGDTSIPLNGYVLSVGNTDDAAKLQVGETVTLTGYLPRVDATMAATNQEGKRILIDGKNVARSKPMIVIYTSDYGATTKTNQWGREMVVALDDNGDLKVVRFRDFNTGDSTGIEIPKWGFVLSAYAEPYITLLKEGERFNLGDTITLQGVSLIELDKQVSFQYAAINPTMETNPGGIEDPEIGKTYPGLRGPDQLIIYTPEWDTPNTGTNAYGFEVRVEGTLENGTVTAKGGNNSAIPENGYILSGHGKAASFLIGNAAVGAKVRVEKESKIVTISTTPESIMESVQNAINAAQEAYHTAKEGLYDVNLDQARTALQKAKNKFEEAKVKLKEADAANEKDQYMLLVEFMDLLEQSRHQCDLVYYRTLESRRVEGRAVWHRPSEVTLEEIQANLDELASNHFNLVFVETFYNGYSIFPSDTDLIIQNPQFAKNRYGEYGNDILKAYVEEGKKRGIEVHAWVENFFVGVEWNNPKSPILEQKPEWALVHYDGGIVTPNENRYLFMDPAIPEVRQLLVDLYKEIVTEYDVKGVQLDYIRYPVGHYKSDSGYGEYSVKTFKALYNIPHDVEIREAIDREKHPEMWKKWKEWKQNNITTFVERVRNELKAINQDLILSTAIFANTTEAIETKMQNWPLWVQNGWIDITAPMAYYRDTKTVQENVESMVGKVNGNALNYAGIAPSFMGLPARMNAEQTRAVQLGHAQGSAIFASQFVLGLEDVEEVLHESTYRKEAVLPHGDLDTILDAAFEDLLDKADRIYIPTGNMTRQQRKMLEQRLRAVTAMPKNKSVQLETVIHVLCQIARKSSLYADGQAAERIAENLDYLMDILKIRVKRMALAEVASHPGNGRSYAGETSE